MADRETVKKPSEIDVFKFQKAVLAGSGSVEKSRQKKLSLESKGCPPKTKETSPAKKNKNSSSWDGEELSPSSKAPDNKKRRKSPDRTSKTPPREQTAIVEHAQSTPVFPNAYDPELSSLSKVMSSDVVEWPEPETPARLLPYGSSRYLKPDVTIPPRPPPPLRPPPPPSSQLPPGVTWTPPGVRRISPCPPGFTLPHDADRSTRIPGPPGLSCDARNIASGLACVPTFPSLPADNVPSTVGLDWHAAPPPDFPDHLTCPPGMTGFIRQPIQPVPDNTDWTTFLAPSPKLMPPEPAPQNIKSNYNTQIANNPEAVCPPAVFVTPVRQTYDEVSENLPCYDSHIRLFEENRISTPSTSTETSPEDKIPDKPTISKPATVVGKHPALLKASNRNRARANWNNSPSRSDTDQEVNKILSTPKAHGPRSNSGNRLQTIPTFNELKEPGGHVSRYTAYEQLQKQRNTVPTFSQIHDYQTPPGTGTASRYSSPHGSCSPSPSKSRYTGKPRSSNSSPQSREVRISKMLSGICRHRNGNGTQELLMLDGGYFMVTEILSTLPFKKLSVTQTEVEEIVRNNDKQRFSLGSYEGNLTICANQGHTIEVTGLELQPVLNDEGLPSVVHGTFEEAWLSIQTQGLSRMNRNHVHFAAGLPTHRGVISGMRSDCEIIIYLDLAKAIAGGLKFYRSKNNVILSPGDENGFISPKYFKSVIRIKGHQQLYQASESNEIPGYNPDSSSPNMTSSRRNDSNSRRSDSNIPGYNPDSGSTNTTSSRRSDSNIPGYNPDRTSPNMTSSRRSDSNIPGYHPDRTSPNMTSSRRTDSNSRRSDGDFSSSSRRSDGDFSSRRSKSDLEYSSRRSDGDTSARRSDSDSNWRAR